MRAMADPDSVRSADAHVDGRSLRRERNREAVIEAFLELVREGDLDPGGAEIAQRAGVSHRSVFRYFDDLADLTRTAIGRELERGIAVGTVADIGVGKLADRVARLVDARLATFAEVHGIATVARLRSTYMPALHDEFGSLATHTRELIERQFAPELTAIPAGRRGGIVDAVQVLTSWDAYDLQLRLYGHSIERIRKSTVAGITALLAS